MVLAERTMYLILLVVLGLMMNQVPAAEASRIPAEDVSSCVEGSSFNDGCNDCVCSNGHAVCTQKACPEFPNIEFPILRDACDLQCTKILLPVCGSDGDTYNNVCELDIAACQHPEADIRVQHEGRCGEDIVTCKSDEFTCHKDHISNCIPLNWVCDGSPDCLDRSDEKSCNANCTSEQFTCSNGNCISKRWHCDGDNDCGADDHSDEENCPIEECTPSQIQCPNGHCIEASWICDNSNDCGDGFDEKQNCTEKMVHCREDEYSCYGGFQCIRRGWLCDDDVDCPHGDDESLENCKMSCPTGSFTCGDNSCIPENLKCNGFPECADHSDEKDCPTSDAVIRGNDGASVRSDGRCGPRFLAPNGRMVECNQNNNGNCCMVSEYCGGWNCQAE